MKTLLLSVLCLGIFSSQSFATDHNYQCIADSLQAINSDIYYNLSSTDIDAMLTIPEMMGHNDAINAAKRCDDQAIKLQCVADGLEAYNSDIYYALSNEEVRAMLTIPEMMGHNDAVRIAKYCNL